MFELNDNPLGLKIHSKPREGAHTTSPILQILPDGRIEFIQPDSAELLENQRRILEALERVLEILGG